MTAASCSSVSSRPCGTRGATIAFVQACGLAALTAAGLVLQALGVLIERSDAGALGDNFGGLLLYLPLLVFLLVQYSRTLDVLDRAEADHAGEEEEGEAEDEGELIRMPAA